jgi:actin-related protein
MKTMIGMLQLQRMSDDGTKNLGGLYIAIQHVAAIYATDSPKRLCRIVLSSGVEFTTVQSVSEVLDDFNLRNH